MQRGILPRETNTLTAIKLFGNPFVQKTDLHVVNKLQYAYEVMIPKLGRGMGPSGILKLSSMANIRETFFDYSETKFCGHVIIGFVCSAEALAIIKD